MGPILAGLASQALTAGGTAAAAVSFLVAGLAIVALMFTLALLLASAREQLVDAMKNGAATMKGWGGRVLIGVGAWFILLGVFADFFADIFPV